jgi:hypothetical protein
MDSDSLPANTCCSGSCGSATGSRRGILRELGVVEEAVRSRLGRVVFRCSFCGAGGLEVAASWPGPACSTADRCVAGASTPRAGKRAKPNRPEPNPEPKRAPCGPQYPPASATHTPHPDRPGVTKQLLTNRGYGGRSRAVLRSDAQIQPGPHSCPASALARSGQMIFRSVRRGQRSAIPTR